jgi:acyl phosphate:glycerol-3-phosphate acyltransferase
MAEIATIIQIIALGYMLGSIPFGVALAKLFRLPDPRYIGSGNIGATNMLRTGNKKVALLTLLLDMGKGAAAVLITRHLFGALLIRECHWDAGCVPEEFVISTSYLALAAAIGHMYSPLLKFKGGKGVATLFGGTLAFSWPVGMATFFVWAITMFVKRTVSLASIVALVAAPLIAWLRVDGVSAFILAIAAGIAIWKHRENIKRLRKGFEPKISFGRDK